MWATLKVLVTGGASGIGAATASAFAARGASVAVLALTSSIQKGVPAGVRGFAADVTDDDAVRRAMSDVTSAFGGLDVLVNNAGIGAQGTVADNSIEEWRRVLDVNLLGVVRVTRAALPHLKESANASVVNIGSIVATAGLPNRALYAASKGAILSLTMAMAADHLRDAIRFNCVNSGTADTPWIDRLVGAAEDPAAERAALIQRQPHGRLVTAAEVAEAVVYFASPAAGSTTGTALAVDGGLQNLRLRPRSG